MEQGEQAARGILINLLADKLKTCQQAEREQITQELLAALDTERLAYLYSRYIVEPEQPKEASRTSSRTLLLDRNFPTS